MIESYPLPSLSLTEAIERQFALVDLMHEHFNGAELLAGGDLGVAPPLGRPRYTSIVEQVLARFFDAEAAALVRGAGTGAIRMALEAVVGPGGPILLHDAPIYPTTETTIRSMGLKPIFVDYNDAESLADTLMRLHKQHRLQAALVQHTRQSLRDRYDPAATIKQIKQALPDVPIIVDDNYAVLKTAGIGVQYGAHASAFSMFKLLGPEGVGCVVGKRDLVADIHARMSSGGGQVQGHEAMEALRSLVYAPVALALQSQQVDKVVQALRLKPLQHVVNVFAANAQSKVIIVEFDKPIAPYVLRHACELGAAPHPVGAESRYEITALFYRISRTFLQHIGPDKEPYFIRINPMRAGAETVLRILKQAIERALADIDDAR